MQTSLLLEEFKCPPEESNTSCALWKMRGTKEVEMAHLVWTALQKAVRKFKRQAKMLEK